MSDDLPAADQWWRCLSFWMMIQLRILAHQDQAQAERIQQRCPGWARFLHRRALKRARAADVWSGGDENPYAFNKESSECYLRTRRP